jgi:ATP-dependent Clp protease ATP-binding subunit ClpA
MQQTVRHSGRINVREFLNVFGDRLLPHDQRLSEPPLEHSSEVEQAMRDATAHARAERRAQQSSAHLLTVLVRDDHAPIAKLLSRFGANLALLRQQL